MISNSVVFGQVSIQTGLCSLLSSFNEKLQMVFGTCKYLNTHILFKQLEKALINMCVCAGWSEPMLVAHTCTTLLEIACRGSNDGFTTREMYIDEINDIFTMKF